MTVHTGQPDQTTTLPPADELPPPERSELADAGRVVAERVVGMVRDLPDTAVPIPGAEWTVGEAAAHVAFVNIGMALMARGLEIPYADESLSKRQGLAEANAVALDGYTERDGAVLAGRIVDSAERFRAEVLDQPPDRMCTTPMGAFPIRVLASYFIAHVLAHGCAIARALSEPYPFEPVHLRLMWPFLQQALPLVVDPNTTTGLEASIEVRVRGMFRFVLAFHDGRLTVGARPSHPVDCTVEADPLAFFLIAMKLADPSEAVETGRVMISGPRPEIGRRLASFFEIP